MANIFDLLLLKEKKFFTYMDQQADIFLESCKIFKTFISQLKTLSDDDIHSYVGSIKEQELKGDNIERFIMMNWKKRSLLPLTGKTSTPFVTNIDRSLDILHGISQKVEIYRCTKCPPTG